MIITPEKLTAIKIYNYFTLSVYNLQPYTGGVNNISSEGEDPRFQLLVQNERLICQLTV